MTVQGRNRSQAKDSLRLEQSLSDPHSAIENVEPNMSEPHPWQQLTQMITSYWVSRAIYLAAKLRIADHLHVPAIRIPMMLLALAGATWNLVALWRVWSLRRRPASAWRQRPVPQAKRRSELLQLVISVVTLLLLAIEEIAHHSHFHRL